MHCLYACHQFGAYVGPIVQCSHRGTAAGAAYISIGIQHHQTGFPFCDFCGNVTIRVFGNETNSHTHSLTKMMRFLPCTNAHRWLVVALFSVAVVRSGSIFPNLHASLGQWPRRRRWNTMLECASAALLFINTCDGTCTWHSINIIIIIITQCDFRCIFKIPFNRWGCVYVCK